MGKRLIALALLGLSIQMHAQEKLFIHLSDNSALGAALTEIREMKFDVNGEFLNISTADTSVKFSMMDIDSISFVESSDTVLIHFENSAVYVTNPLAFSGVSISVDGGKATVRASENASDVYYRLTGSTNNGTLKIYSEKKFNLLFDGLNITNPNGPPLNIQSKKKAYITLVDGTSNTLTDANSYDDEIINDDGETEEQSAAFFAEGSLIFDGSGSLIVHANGANQHAIASDDLVQIDGGKITVASSKKDGIHTNDGFVVTAGTVAITAAGDAVDAGEGYVDISGGSLTTINASDAVSSVKCDSSIVVSNGTVNMTVNGDMAKGFNSKQTVTLSGGSVTIYTTGNAVLEALNSGYDPSYCTAIKCDSLITVNGATVTITTSGDGGKGISSDGDINILSGVVTVTSSSDGNTYTNSSGTKDAYNSTCLTADGDINIVAGTVSTSSSGSAGKGIKSDGNLTIGSSVGMPEVTITTTGSSITISSTTGGGGRPGGGTSTGDAAEAKAISCDGAVTINNGTVLISSADDGIKSTSSITVNNGTVSITKSTEGMESPSITVNDGNVSINSSDDGFNATNGNGGESNDGSYLYLNGGDILVNVTNGDGIDSNGNVEMTGGRVVVHGPTSSPEVGIDVNGTFNISGGFLMVTGPNSGNMIEATSTSSAQYAIKATASSQLSSSTLFHLQDANGNTLVTYKPVRNVYYVVFSSPELKSGSSYSIYTGGSSTGTLSNGTYIDGTYSGGTLKKTFTVSSKVTNVTF